MPPIRRDGLLPDNVHVDTNCGHLIITPPLVPYSQSPRHPRDYIATPRGLDRAGML